MCYLQRQLLARDQRIAEQSHEIEQFKTWSTGDTTHSVNIVDANKKIVPVQILRGSDPDLVISTVGLKRARVLLRLPAAIALSSCLSASSLALSLSK